MIEIKVAVTELAGLRKNLLGSQRVLDRETKGALEKSLLSVERKVKPLIPVGKTGSLRASFGGAGGWRWIKGRKASIGTGLRYAIYVEKETSPHVILPRTKQALFWPEAPHPYKKVRHPGTKAVRFAERGAQASLPDIERHFGEAIGKVAIEITK